MDMGELHTHAPHARVSGTSSLRVISVVVGVFAIPKGEMSACVLCVFAYACLCVNVCVYM